MKKVQIGARISGEDAEFLNLLEIDGATTPSDKLRAIIEEARLRRQYTSDYSGWFRQIQEQLNPLIEKIKKVEFEQNVHSAFLVRILEWMPDFYAYCLTSLSEEKGEVLSDLQNYERGALERVARLFEALLHLELSMKQQGYSTDVFKDILSPIEEIITIIKSKNPKQEGGVR